MIEVVFARRIRPALHWPIGIVAIVAIASAACDANPAMERLSQARHQSADLQVHFTTAADAANRAVMADTDEASVAFARDAEQARHAVETTIDALKPLLEGLNYSEESRLLHEFVTRFAAYRELDARILDLAVENTNVKAQRLSFGPAQEAADAFRDALASVTPPGSVERSSRVDALTATALAALRDIQVAQAPHIADADDAVMARMEQRMRAAETVVRTALDSLASSIQPAGRPGLVAATAALDRFMAVNAQVIALSHRNTNVRSLALSLNEKGKVTRECEDSLSALRDALAARGFTGTR